MVMDTPGVKGARDHGWISVTTRLRVVFSVLSSRLHDIYQGEGERQNDLRRATYFHDGGWDGGMRNRSVPPHQERVISGLPRSRD